MDIARLEHRTPFITMDGSEIRELAGLPTGNSTNQSLAHATVAPLASTDAHYHPVAEEIYLFVSGAGRMVLGGEESPVRAGDCVVIPPGTEHQLVNDDAREPLVLLCCCSPPYSARGHGDHVSRGSSGLTAGPCSTVPSTPKREPWQGQSHERSAALNATWQ